MKEKITLQNTLLSFTPSFLGNGWETSLSPQFERQRTSVYEYKITFRWIKSMLLKMREGRKCIKLGGLATTVVGLFI